VTGTYGSFTYTPDADFYGSDTFEYEVCDTEDLCDTAMVYITVNSVNDAPIALDDEYNLTEDTPLTIDAPGVLANDTDVDEDSLSVNSYTAPSHGTLELESDGSFSYTPDPDYCGSDSATYTVSDGNGGEATAIASFVIDCVNDPPVVSASLETQTVQYSDAIAEVTFTAVDIDSAGEHLTASASGVPANLSLSDKSCTDNATGTTCTWTLSGVVDVQVGAYSIEVVISDGELTDTDETTIIVNKEATQLTVEDVTVQYSDSVELSATLTDDDGTLLAGKSVDFVTDACSGSAPTDTDGVAVFTCGPVTLPAGDYDIEVSYAGEDTYYEASSDTGTLTVIEETTEIDVDDASVQYSDSVELSATLTDDDGTPLEGKSLSFEVAGACSGSAPTDTDGVAVFTCGPVTLPAGDYDIEVSYAGEDAYYEATTGAGTLTVEPEEVRIRFHGGNPVAVRVVESGGSSGLFDLMVRVREAYNPETDAEPTGEPLAFPGDISQAQVDMMLIPVGPGGNVSPVECVSSVADTGYDAKQTVVCSFDQVSVNTYIVQVTVHGGYFAGTSEDVLVVYDPSLGYTTGGGSFLWPGTGEITNFGFTMEYNKKGTNVKGSLLLIRHVSEDSSYQVKSNALYGLALGSETQVPSYSWASFGGKSTYLEPGWPEPIGNHEFLVYVEDHDEPGSEGSDPPVDRFWIQVRDKDGNVIQVMSMDNPATDPYNSEVLQDGNIFVPYSGGKKTNIGDPIETFENWFNLYLPMTQK
jgi:hypothetical protein